MPERPDIVFEPQPRTGPHLENCEYGATAYGSDWILSISPAYGWTDECESPPTGFERVALIQIYPSGPKGRSASLIDFDDGMSIYSRLRQHSEWQQEAIAYIHEHGEDDARRADADWRQYFPEDYADEGS